MTRRVTYSSLDKKNVAAAMTPLLFLDIDDVFCLNRPYGGYDVASPSPPADLWSRLWHRPALDVLRDIVDRHAPRVVVTSSWLRIMLLSDLEGVFRRTDASWLADALHPDGETLQPSGVTRAAAIDQWLAWHGPVGSYVVLDDPLSGTGLVGSTHDRAGRVVLCDVDVGLMPRHARQVAQALAKAPT